MILYYITDRTQFAGADCEKRQRLLAKIAEAASAGVDYIQVREKDLCARELEALGREAVKAVRAARGDTAGAAVPHRPATKLLINSRTDIALAAGADGVHLRGDDIPASDSRSVWSHTTSRNSKLETRNFLVAVSCHSPSEVALAESHGANFVVFAPVFEKSGKGGTGLEALRQACHRAAFPSPNTEDRRAPSMPVLALGGITLDNAGACIEAGAAGIAGIRLFQENDVHDVVRRLRDKYVDPSSD